MGKFTSSSETQKSPKFRKNLFHKLEDGKWNEPPDVRFFAIWVKVASKPQNIQVLSCKYASLLLLCHQKNELNSNHRINLLSNNIFFYELTH